MEGALQTLLRQRSRRIHFDLGGVGAPVWPEGAQSLALPGKDRCLSGLPLLLSPSLTILAFLWS